VRQLQTARGASIAGETPVAPDENSRPARAKLIGLFAAVAVAGVLLDLAAKVLAVRHLDHRDSDERIGSGRKAFCGGLKLAECGWPASRTTSTAMIRIAGSRPRIA